MTKGTYKYPMAITQQFRHCGNPFRLDAYKNCTFGCSYCFANNRTGGVTREDKVADVSIVEKMFFKAFETDKEYKNITIEMIRKRVPLHFGGMSDPFQPLEFEVGASKEILKITNRYNYPVVISTKNTSFPQEYWDLFDPQIHSFQVSIMGLDEEFVGRFEANTNSVENRINFVKELKSKGFWVSVRIQPLVDVNEAIKLIAEIEEYVDFITIEHLKIPNHHVAMKNHLLQASGRTLESLESQANNYVIPFREQKENIEKIKACTKVPIGCGDNLFHDLSTTNNCCGLDTMNDNFSNWIKCNTMYMEKTGDSSQWYPKNSCQSCFTSDTRKKEFGFKDYVHAYLEKLKEQKQKHGIQ